MSDMSDEQGQNMWQRVAEHTYGVVTPANAIDAAAFAVAMVNASEMDTPEGIAAVAGSYLADLADGAVARATGTASELGAAVDALGDKIKTAYVGYHIARKGLASTGLLAAVGAYHAATAGAATYDRLKHDEPQVETSIPGKRAVFAGSLGLGLQVIGNKVAESDRRAGRAISTAGAVIGYAGLTTYGVTAVKDYWRTARS